ncbi:nitroreductase family protein [Chitinimonas naiadis]
MRFKRAGALLAYWQETQLVFHNYAQRCSVAANASAIPLLELLGDWQTRDALIAALPGYAPASIDQAIRELLAQGLLVEEGTPAAGTDQAISRDWAPWLPEASFHFSSKNTAYVNRDSSAELKAASLPESPPPEFHKSLPDAPQLALPARGEARSDFERTLLARRTHRKFSTQALSLAEVAHLLGMCWGVTGHAETPTFGRLPLKTSPSGGARHPVEVYLMALNVEGLAPGIYHYHALAHHLEALPGEASPALAAQYCADQRYTGNAAALFLMTAVFPRTMWKYHKPRAYRVVLLDAGHLAQTFCLLATDMGLAPFCTAALKDTQIEQDLGIDGINESILYVTGVGHPLPT